MNNARRKQIKEAIKALDIGTLEAVKEELESAQSDEQEYLDNMPESLGDNPDLHQAYLGASCDCLYLEDGETGELVMVDCQTGEGMSIHVYDGELAWELPLDGGEAVQL